jgi:hypothetical protein
VPNQAPEVAREPFFATTDSPFTNRLPELTAVNQADSSTADCIATLHHAAVAPAGQRYSAKLSRLVPF